jgi:hypothetical protein
MQPKYLRKSGNMQFGEPRGEKKLASERGKPYSGSLTIQKS